LQHLLLNVSAQASWLDESDSSSNSPLFLTGNLAVAGNLRRLSSFEAHILTLYAWKVDDDLWFPLTTDQLIALDSERNAGGDLHLILNLAPTLFLLTEGLHYWTTMQSTLRISAGEWLGMLDQLGTEVGIAVRVPSPLAEDGGSAPPPDAATVRSRAQAAGRLRQARQHFRDGRPEECVAACRLVCENLGLLSPLPDRGAVFSTPAQTRSQEQRWAALRWDLASLTSAAHHDDQVTQDFTWTTRDAEVVLALTAALASQVLGV